MKLKLLFLFALVQCGANCLLAQTLQPLVTGTKPAFIKNSTSLKPVVYSGSVDPEYLACFPPISFDIYFWIINRSDGTSNYIITDNDILKSVKKINELFKPMGICFVLKGYDYINNDTIYQNVSLSTMRDYTKKNNYVIPNCFNVYIPRSLSFGNGLTTYGSNTLMINYGRVLGTNGEIPGASIAHELAHDFNLYHPWGTAADSTKTPEHVTRDPNNPDYNALTTGDRIHDTPAMASFWTESKADSLTINDVIDVKTCTYTGHNTDALGNPFQLTPLDIGNIMGNTLPQCTTGFTTGQGIRIREYIAGTTNSLSVQAMRKDDTDSLPCTD